MGDNCPGVLPSADYGYSALQFDGDDDLSIDIETFYRILDESPGTPKGSQGDSSQIGSSTESGKLENSQLQSGSRVTDRVPSWDYQSCSLRASDTAAEVASCSFNDERKVELRQSSSPAYTCSASLKDWFSLSQGEQYVEQFGASHSEMPRFSTLSISMDRDSTCFSDHGGDVVLAHTVSKCENDRNDSKFAARSPTKVNSYVNGVPEFGSGTTGASEMSTFYHNSDFFSDDAGDHVSSPLYCYNSSDASLAEASDNFPPSFGFRLFPEETSKDTESRISVCPSYGVCSNSLIFDHHGGILRGSIEREPALDVFRAGGDNFKFDVNPLVSPAYDRSYKSFDSHLGDKEFTHLPTTNLSSGFEKNEVAYMKDKPENDSVELESLMYGSNLGKDGALDEGFDARGSRCCSSSVSSRMCSFHTNVEREYPIRASEVASLSIDISKFVDSNASLQNTRSQDPVTPSFELDFLRDERDHGQIHSRSMDINLSKVSPESTQSSSPEYRSCTGDDSDVYIIETNGQLVPPHQSLVVRKAALSLENSVVSQSYYYGSMKLRSNDEQRIFQAALQQDLSQPKSEATPPDGVLAVPLLRHQRIALSWMVQKEINSFPCSGGILADDQGLGKTVSTIALILKERPILSRIYEEGSHKEIFDLEDEDVPSKPNKENQEPEQSQVISDEGKASGYTLCKTKGRPAAGTLVVCPTSVLRQWTDELRNKVTSDANLSVLVYYGPNRTKDPYELAKFDVVITTYSIVSMEVPKQPLVDVDDEEKGNFDCSGAPSVGFGSNKKRKCPPGPQKKGSKQRKGVDFASFETLSGTLAKVSWFRVVLDEAQSIKNHRTQVARACWGLRSKRRWCLSGTPIQNAVDDLYSYFRFLRYEPYSVYTTFCSTIKNLISRNQTKGYQKLQAVLKTIMLRRTKGTLLDGKPIISLPPKFIELRKVDFTKEERDFYSRLECDSRDQFREYAEAGTVQQNYVNILLMLLRLRQACDHPLLVKGYEFSSTWKSSVEMAKKLPHEKQVSLLNCLEASLAICGICNDAPEDAVVSICGHVFCKQCICEHLTGDDNQCPIVDCKVRLTVSSLFSKATLDASLSKMHGVDDPVDRSASDPTGDAEPSLESIPYGSSKIKAALDVLQSLARPQSLTLKDDSNQRDAQHDRKSLILPDTAVKNVGNGLDCLSKEVVGEKAIVFSQWTKMLDLLEGCLRRSSIQYRRLDGTMSVVARDKAVKDFNTVPEVSVMIMSLKAASLGLNMVAACHVLMLDLWWNPTTEDQAIDRAHRIGQTRPVTVVRLTVKDTVEDRILALQEKKRTMVASAFGEDEKGSRQTRLTLDDLKYLFMMDK